MYLSSKAPSTAKLPQDVSYRTFDAGDSLQRWSSFVGIITAIAGNILISFALNIQRYAHIRLHEEQAQRRDRLKSTTKGSPGKYGTIGTSDHIANHGQDGDDDSTFGQKFDSRNTQLSGYSSQHHTRDSTYLRSPYWWGGIVLMTIGEAGNFLAYGFAPASIVSLLGVVALISNCVIAPIMLKENFRLRDFWGVLVAVGGAVTVVLSAKTEEKKLGPHEIWGAITTVEFEVYMATTITIMGILIWASPKYGNKTILIDLGVVGLFGGYTALSTKAVASVLSSTLWRTLTTPLTYGLLAVLVSTAVMQVKYINRALQRFDSTQVIPVQFVMFTISVIIGSAVLYRDFEKTTTKSASKFIGGCLLTFLGVCLITSGRSSHDEADEGSDAEGEESYNFVDQEEYADGEETSCNSRQQEACSKSGPNCNGDAPNDEDTVASKSSKVGFAAGPRTPRIYSNSPPQPSITVPYIGYEELPLLANPLQSFSEEPLHVTQRPGIISVSHSSSTITTVPQSSGESLRLPSTSITNCQGNSHTHPNLQVSPTLPQLDMTERPVTPARNTMSRMMSGPLISPLSGGVVIADSLRRGINAPFRGKNSQSPRFSLRRSKSGSQRLRRAHRDGELGTSPLKDGNLAREVSKSLEAESSWGRIRARSLSNTLGGFFRAKKKPDIEAHEAGPSGSGG